MRLFTSITLILITISAYGQQDPDLLLDPNSIDSEMTKVMYRIGPKDIRTTSYSSGHPSAFELKLCDNCQKKVYQLEKNAHLLLNEEPLALADLAINLIKKKFDVIQLGIDRNKQSVTYLYLGGLSEASPMQLEQE